MRWQKFFRAEKKQDNVSRAAVKNTALPQEALERYISQIEVFTSQLPAILKASEALNQKEKRHLDIIQDFQGQINEIFHRQEEISRSSSLVLDTSREYKQSIVKTQEIMEQLLASFDQAWEINQQVQGSVDTLSAGISDISSLVKMLSDLAISIRQLSRNAEIMSYHAGQQGKGLAVIVEKMVELTGELEKAAGLTPGIDRDIHQRLELINGRAESIKSLAVNLRKNTEEVKKELNQIFSYNQRIIQGFEDIQQATEQQRVLRERLVGGIEAVSSLAENLGVSQEVTATMLSTEMADAGQIDFTREQLEEALKIEKATGAAWAHKQVLIELFLLRIKLEAARNRWRDLNKSLSSLRETVREKERVPAQLLQELENLFQYIETIGSQLGRIGQELSQTQSISLQIEQNLSQAGGFLEQWQSWLAEVEKKYRDLSGDLGRLQDIGETVRKFAEQIKLLAFYSAVEVADMGQMGQELAPLVSQTRQLANQANLDSNNLTPLLGKLEKDTESGAALVKENLQALDLIRNRLGEANWLLRKLVESSEQFEVLGQETIGLIEQQRQKREDLAKIYTNFAESFQNVNQHLEDLYRLLEKAAQAVEGFDRLNEQLFNQISMEALTAQAFGRLRLHLSSDPLGLDPAMTTDSTSNEIVAQIFQGLVEFDKSSKVIPGLAWHWSISADGLTWTFNLRRGVTFHNGREITAYDVKYSLERLVRKDVGSPNAYFVDMIQGAQECLSGRSHSLSGVRVIDPLCLEITLRAPYMPFLANLATAATSVVPKEEVERLGPDFSRRPVGSGSFRLEEWRPGEKIVLRGHRRTVSLDQVEYIIGRSEEERQRLFLDQLLDQVDIHQHQVEEYRARGKKIEKVASLNVQYICINVSQPTPFAHRLVRQALNYAIDRQALIDRTELRGEAIIAKGVFPPSLEAYNPELRGYDYNPDMAKKLLAEAGFPLGLPGEYDLDIRDIRAQMERAEIVKDYCQQVGIKIKIVPLSWKDLLDKAYSGQSLLSFRGWSSDNGDPDNFLYPLFHSRNWGRSGNTAFFKSPQVDQMLDQALAMRNPLERLACYRQLEKILVEEAPWVFLYHSIRYSAVQPWVHGYRPRPMGAPRLRDCWVEPHDGNDASGERCESEDLTKPGRPE